MQIKIVGEQTLAIFILACVRCSAPESANSGLSLSWIGGSAESYS